MKKTHTATLDHPLLVVLQTTAVRHQQVRLTKLNKTETLLVLLLYYQVGMVELRDYACA